MKIRNKRELQQIALNHSSDIEVEDFVQLYKDCTKEPFAFLVNYRTLSSDYPLLFTKSLYKKWF